MELPGHRGDGTAVETVATSLLKSSHQSWAEPDLGAARAQKGPNDEAGPFDLGIAVRDRPVPGDDRPTASRLVVFSSRYLADNATAQSAPSNLDLLMNAVGWLRGRPEYIGIPPQKHVALTINADPALRARLILVPSVLAVLLIVTLGVTTYLARRD